MHHFVVRQRQHEVLEERVPDRERQAVVVVLAEDRLLPQVVQRVVHPSHVPLHAESQPAEIDGPRHHRPRGGFLGDHLGVRIVAIDRFVQVAQERDRTEILPPAECVGNPLAFLARIVEVEHRRDRVDAQPVDVILVEPEQRTGQQERAHLVTIVIEDRAVPFRMEALALVGVLVQVRAVEVGKAVAVRGEMRRHPVDDHADAALVEDVDEVHEVLRCAIARGRREVPGRLVSPRAVERVLGHRHQLDMRKAPLAHMVGEWLRNVAIRRQPIAVVAPPRAQMHFVDRDRRVERVACAPRRHPCAVAPVVVERPRARRGGRRSLGELCERIGLVDFVAAIGRHDAEFVGDRRARRWRPSSPRCRSCPREASLDWRPHPSH